ncbi:MAG: hypothetical protein V4679_12960 [Pseudomonadota bacterium]
MAIIVPIVMAATGATTAIAASLTVAFGTTVSAAMVTAVTSIALQVTGINNKINKAASKVFGEDLVNVANVVGAVYGAVNGGFNFGEGGAGLTEAGGALGTKAMLDGTTAFGANSAQGAFNLADAANVGKAAMDGTNVFGNHSIMGQGDQGLLRLGGDGLPINEAAEVAKVAGPAASAGTSVAAPGQPLGMDIDPIEGPTDLPRVHQTGAAAPVAGPEQQIFSRYVQHNASAPVTAPAVAGGSATAPVAPVKGSFFDRLGSLATSEKGLGAIVQGVGTGITNASKERLEREKMAMLERNYRSVSGVRVA